MIQEVEDLKAAYAAARVEVQTGIAGLMAKIEDLQTQIENDPDDLSDIIALTATIKSDTAALHDSLNPPSPTPTPEPVPDNSDPDGTVD